MLAATLARLAALTDETEAPLFRDVLGAMELSLVLDQGVPQRSPTAYVVLLSEDADPDVRGSGAYDQPQLQRVQSGVGVVIALHAGNDRLGTANNSQLQALRIAVRRSLFGWAPAGGYEPFTLGPGRLLAMRKGLMYWADQFRTDYYEESIHGL